jgi:hypothetical protein
LLLPTVLLAVITPLADARRLATLTVALDGPVSEQGVPVSVELVLPAIPPEAALGLSEVRGAGREPVPMQLTAGAPARIHWLVSPRADGSVSRVYELLRVPALTGVGAPEMTIADTDGVLTLRAGERELLGYHHAVQAPPEGVAAAFARSGFIHPLRAPHGQALTRIQPADHFHHFGLWAPWTHVLFEGREVDFWNIGDRKGTVRFAQFAGLSEGPVFAEYRAEQEHIVLRPEGGEETALHEVQTVRVYRMLAPDSYLLDLTIRLRCAGNSPVRLLEYRYGGLGWRATAEWNKTNSEVLTSEGLTRREADGSKARWCLVQGVVDSGGDYAGVAWLNHPENFNSPAPLRVWPEDQNGRGDLFVNFAPTKDRDWPLEPGQEYVLRYRFVVFNGRCAADVAEAAWRNFAKPPVVQVKLE